MDQVIKDRIKEHQYEIVKREHLISQLRGTASNVRIVDVVLEQVSKDHGVGVFEIIGDSRKKQLMSARRDFIKIMRDEYCWSFEMIGNILGKSHSGIMYLYKN